MLIFDIFRAWATCGISAMKFEAAQRHFNKFRSDLLKTIKDIAPKSRRILRTFVSLYWAGFSVKWG